MQRTWSELSPPQKSAIVVLAGVELALTSWAVADLIRRPAHQVRGPKALWACALAIQPVGPPTYLIFGRSG